MKPSPFQSLPVLDQVKVASPCEMPWEDMQGDERTRFCSHCNLHVYNLSAMTRNEAESFLQKQTGRTCVRLYRRVDGSVMTQDCPVGLAAVRRRMAVMMGALGAVGYGLIMGAVGLFYVVPGGPRGQVRGVSRAFEIIANTFRRRSPEELGDVVTGVVNKPPVLIRETLGEIIVPPRVIPANVEQGGCPAPPKSAGNGQ